MQFRLKLAKEENGAGGGGSAPDKAVSNRVCVCVNNTRGKTKLPGKKEEPNATHTHNTHTEGGNWQKTQPEIITLSLGASTLIHPSGIETTPPFRLPLLHVVVANSVVVR